MTWNVIFLFHFQSGSTLGLDYIPKRRDSVTVDLNGWTSHFNFQSFAFCLAALSWMGGNPHMEMTARELRDTVEMAFNRWKEWESESSFSHFHHSSWSWRNHCDGSAPNLFLSLLFTPDWIQTKMGCSQEKSLWPAVFRCFQIPFLSFFSWRILCWYSGFWQCHFHFPLSSFIFTFHFHFSYSQNYCHWCVLCWYSGLRQCTPLIGKCTTYLTISL